MLFNKPVQVRFTEAQFKVLQDLARQRATGSIGGLVRSVTVQALSLPTDITIYPDFRGGSGLDIDGNAKNETSSK